ncbi:MAG: GGDEF domain-containing protein [Bacteriovorax sp.]|nr:GGDEF domain-containing protein [Bacteriovorax sp.]
MTLSLSNFLSNFPFFENEKNLISHIEEFLAADYLVRPLLVYSIHNKISQIDIKKCRTVLGKTDRQQLYSTKLLDDLFIKRSDLKTLSCLSVKVESCFYYYLNLGFKKSQFHFAVFSAPSDISTDVLTALSQFAASHLKIIQKFEDLYKTHELIHIDDVTGLYNQRKLYKDLALLVDKFQKEKDPFCVLFIDIDYFKKVNDTYGHLVGTKLLENVARDIKILLRDSDISYRYGGDEFVVILVNSDAAAGKIVGERILQIIKERMYEVDIRDEKKMVKLSVSIGVAEFPTDAVNSQEILAIADRMMYEAKESGRGVVFNTQDIFKSSLKKAIDLKKAGNGNN